MRLALPDNRFWRQGKFAFALLRAAGEKWSSDNVPRLSAAFSFYAMLSLAPFLVLGTVMAVYFVGTNATGRYSLMHQIKDTAGQQAADLLGQIVQHAQSHQATGALASLVSFGVMFFSASNLFLQLDDAVRAIWGQPEKGSFVKLLVRARLTAFTSVILFGGGLIGWLYLDARMAYLAHQATDLQIGRLVSFLITLVVLTVACCISMKQWSTVSLKWTDVWIGGLFSATGLTIAKYLLGLYFAGSGIESVYGPGGALVVILLWIYYCSQIYFFGLEVVCVYAFQYGSLRKVPEKPVHLPEVAPTLG